MGKAIHNFKGFLASRKGQIMFNVIYSWGAAVVILGVMFKIMHFPGGDWILMAGMIVEVLVFFAAGLDYSSYDVPKSGESEGLIIGGGSAINTSINLGETSTLVSEKGRKGEGQGSVVVIAGGSQSANNASSSSQAVFPSTGTQPPHQNAVGASPSSGNYSEAAQSLNEASQKMQDVYSQISGTQDFAENLSALNQNIKGLNDVFNTQLQAITEQMSAVRYINDSLQRMKNLYDGAIGDSYMFREETAKMTKHIEALNNVYARLLQAMTTNNNNNMNPNNF